MPCACCARGEWDFCRNGKYTERGIKEIHGYASEQWTVEADYAVKLDAGRHEQRQAPIRTPRGHASSIPRAPHP